jgi:DUF4097 and DUF4098 domain-containing protein YvlB
VQACWGHTWQVINYPFDDIVSVSLGNDYLNNVSMVTSSGSIAVEYLGSELINTTKGGKNPIKRKASKSIDLKASNVIQ